MICNFLKEKNLTFFLIRALSIKGGDPPSGYLIRFNPQSDTSPEEYSRKAEKRKLSVGVSSTADK